jgi:hypothetical protein
MIKTFIILKVPETLNSCFIFAKVKERKEKTKEKRKKMYLCKNV